MIVKPYMQDIRNIGYYIGEIASVLGFVMLIPCIAGFVLFKEFDPALHFLIGSEVALAGGLLLRCLCGYPTALTVSNSMVLVSVAWLIAMVLNAVPLYLGGHYKMFLDACFETMSGLSTTGLSLVRDLDHLSNTHNLWRHCGPFLGGQGIIIAVLAIISKGSSSGLALYSGEGRDEKILPNIRDTARFIWLVSFMALFLGTLILGFIGISIGFKPASAFYHGVCIFMAGFDTAGFTPRSQSLLYYHSMAYECIIVILMVLGSLNFNLQYQLLRGKYHEIWKDIESKTFFVSVLLLFVLVAVGLHRLNVYPDSVALFRKGFFQLISGHTTTGYMTVYAQQFINEWGDIALIGIICAMALGGSACSTAGGIKMLRAGVIAKAIKEDIITAMLPQSARRASRFYHIRPNIITNRQFCTMAVITTSYIIIYLAGAVIGTLLGYPFLDSLFESTSAAANVGFSCGITSPDMPVLLKITYIIQMWAGRLEFMSVTCYYLL